jgi:parallel beta-helix repeat protein
MRSGVRWLVVVLAVPFGSLAASAAASAASRFVATVGVDAGDCTTAPCRTIGYAVAQAAPGDTVYVGSGTYMETVTVDKRLALVGSSTPSGDGHRGHDAGANRGEWGDRRYRATIDATGHDNGVVITGAGSAGSVLRGFTIRNAGREGVFARQTSNLTIEGNALFKNDAYGPNSLQCPADDPDDCGEALHLQTVTDSVVDDNLVQDNVGGILLTDEDGPTSGNIVSNNRVLGNSKDCGITLASHYFSMAGPVEPGTGGVYLNQVLGNVSIGNGAAGIGVFAGPPGAAAWGNVVAGNVARNNGLPGVAIHSHTPGQNASDNVVAYNTLSGNGPDDDANTVEPTGIAVFSAVVPIPHTTIAHNQIQREHYGVFTVNAATLTGLGTNTFAHSVDVPVSQH